MAEADYWEKDPLWLNHIYLGTIIRQHNSLAATDGVTAALNSADAVDCLAK